MRVFLMGSHYSSLGFGESPKKVAETFARISGASMAIMGGIDPARKATADYWVGNGEAGTEAARRDFSRKVSQVVLRQIALTEPESASHCDRTFGGAPQAIWSEADQRFVAIGERVGHLVPFAAFAFERPHVVSPRQRRDLGRIALIYVGQLLRGRAHGTRSEFASLSSAVLSTLSMGLIVVEPSGVVHYLNDGAREWLGTHDALLIKDNKLMARTVKSHQALSAAMANAAGAAHELAALQMETPDGIPAGAVVVLPMRWTQPRALVVLKQEQEDGALRELILRTLGLTTAERRLVHHLLAGRSLAEAAVQDQLTVSTARSYLKRVFAKTGMHRQADLLKLCHSMTPPVRTGGSVKLSESSGG